jgi:hypothetical protein
MSWAAAWTAFETRSALRASAAIWPSATAVWAATTIGASAAAIASAVASTAAIRPLEARARVAADACGVAREVFLRSGRAANARGTSLARQENHVLLDGHNTFHDGFVSGCGDHFLVEALALNLFTLNFLVPSVLMLAVFLPGIVLSIFMLTMRFGMFGTFLSNVGGEFRPVGGATCFDFLGFLFAELRNRFGVNFLVFIRFFFGFFLFENGTTRQSIGFRFRGRFFVLGLREISGESGDLIFT